MKVVVADTSPINYLVLIDCIWVNNARMKDLLRNPYCAEQDVRHLRHAFTLGHNELRFGFREQALRDFKPEKDS